MEFKYIRYGVILALLSVLYGGLLGLGFGCCEDSFKKSFKDDAAAVLEEKYNNDQGKAGKMVKKSWVYMKRAHLHSLTMGVISIVLSLVAASLAFSPKLQTGISLLSGFGAVGYGLFWLLAGFLAPGMGSTAMAKETVGLLAQVSTLSFMIAAISLFCVVGYKVFTQQS